MTHKQGNNTTVLEDVGEEISKKECIEVVYWVWQVEVDIPLKSWEG